MREEMVYPLSFVAAVAAAAISSCHPPAASSPAPSPECDCPPSVGAEMREAMIERDECQSELRTVLEERAETRVRTRVVERQAPARRCAGEGPVLEPVATVSCAAGMSCLDERNEARLATNLLAWQSWLRRVQACERGEP